jgi:general secretion pathway protein E
MTQHSQPEPLDCLTDECVQACLQQHGLLSASALQSVQHIQQTSAQGSSLLTLLLRTGAVPEQGAFAALARYANLPLINRDSLRESFSAGEQTGEAIGLTPGWCKDQRLAFLAGAAGHWRVLLAGTPSPVARELLGQLRMRHGNVFEFSLVTTSDFLACHEHSAQADTHFGGGLDLQHLKELAEEGPVIELVNSVLSRAVSLRASDVHLEPAEKGFDVRLRVDGSMVELEHYTSIPYEAVVCRVKILSVMDIAERRLPQDGRLDARVNGINFDVRVSVIPTARGESVVLRLLRQERMPQSLHDLGMADADAHLLERWLRLPNGLVLVTGPTGSGKSTTLYTTIDLLGRRTDKIVTVEDPVEYKLSGISQIQVNAEIGLDFAQALRSILRHDPDVILVGEIRDGTTAQIATQAALTGHLVLSTLHTNTAAGAVTRLLDMGVDSFLLADSLKGVMAQRLVRRLCPHCAVPQAAMADAVSQRLQRAGVAQPKVMQAAGCPRCNQTGFLGRIGIYDLIAFDNALAARIKPGITARDIEQAFHESQQSMAWADGWRKVGAGLTTVEEIIGNTTEVALA